MADIVPSVLVVDDEPQIRRLLRGSLEGEGFLVREAASGADAIRSASASPADLIILDLQLPDRDGAEVLCQLREWSRAPVIVLSVRSSEAEKVRLLELGATDYVVKPFGMPELLARAKAALRYRTRESTGASVVKVDRLTIDLAARAVYVGNERLTLTPKEYRLLQILAQHVGSVVTHQRLLSEIWGQRHIGDTHYLRIFVRKLRRKIEADPNRPRVLVTELGVGYRLAPPHEHVPSPSH
jgi:two-component system, OmpR family, KDP operon response regulator KdpE